MPAMFAPLEGFIALRYVRSRRRRGIVSFITGASLLGIALGVAALIVILSVMNGLETEARVRLLSLSAHATLSSPEGGFAAWSPTRDELRAYPGVLGVSPYVTIEGMLSLGSRLYPALIRGIEPDLEYDFEGLARLVEDGDAQSLRHAEPTILIGRALAQNLAASVGDTINVLSATVDGGLPRPHLAPFKIGGIFSAGIAEHDSGLALVNIHMASRIKNLADLPEGLAITVADPLEVRRLRSLLEPSGLTEKYRYADWTEVHRSHFRAIELEKLMMSIILMLVVAVAAFNIVASLMMVVTDKRKDIAILRTCGLEPGRVARIFLLQGSIIGIAGTLIGLVLGLLLAANVESIVPWIEATFHFQIMPGDVYYVTEIPSEIHAFDVIAICISAALFAVLATILPSRRAAAIAPAEALRND
jgi:lipoprotein-releasing system permease protein